MKWRPRREGPPVEVPSGFLADNPEIGGKDNHKNQLGHAVFMSHGWALRLVAGLNNQGHYELALKTQRVLVSLAALQDEMQEEGVLHEPLDNGERPVAIVSWLDDLTEGEPHE